MSDEELEVVDSADDDVLGLAAWASDETPGMVRAATLPRTPTLATEAKATPAVSTLRSFLAATRRAAADFELSMAPSLGPAPESCLGDSWEFPTKLVTLGIRAWFRGPGRKETGG